MSVAAKAIRGAAWTILTGVGSRALGLVGTLLLIRWIAPDDYGEVSAATIVVLTANHFSTLGIGMYVLSNPKADRTRLFTATTLHLGMGVIALAIVFGLRHDLGPMFDAPHLARYVPGMVLSVLIDRIGFMPERLLMRDMRFRTVSLSRTAGELTYTGVSIALAIHGWGGMSVVIGNIARSGVKLCIGLVAVRWREWAEPHRITGKIAGEVAGYGTIIAVGSLASFASRRWDNLLISRFHGTAVLGNYNLSYNLADIPATQVGEQITDVLLASFVHMEPEERRNALVRTTSILALLMFPLAIGLGAVAHTLGEAFFDHGGWSQVGPMLTVLAVMSIPRPIAGALIAYLLALDKPRSVFVIEWANIAVLMALLGTLGRLGPLWACSTIGMAFALRMLITMWFVRHHDGITIRSFLYRLVGPLLACGPMVAAVLATRYAWLGMGLELPAVRLGVEVVAGGVGYLAGAVLFARGPTREVIVQAKKLMARKRSAS